MFYRHWQLPRFRFLARQHPTSSRDASTPASLPPDALAERRCVSSVAGACSYIEAVGSLRGSPPAHLCYWYLEQSLQQTALPGLPARPCSHHLRSLLGSGMEAEAASRHSWLLGNNLLCEFTFWWQQLEIRF